MALAASPWRSSLDARLASVGQSITLTRTYADGSTLAVNCAGFVRTNEPSESVVGAHPSQLDGPLSQADAHIIISGTELDAAGWPAVGGLSLPIRGDKLTTAGRDRIVQLVTPILVADVLVRIEVTARG